MGRPVYIIIASENFPIIVGNNFGLCHTLAEAIMPLYILSVRMNSSLIKNFNLESPDVFGLFITYIGILNTYYISIYCAIHFRYMQGVPRNYLLSVLYT